MSRLLDDAKRMVLAWPGTAGPILTPMAFWWDGRHVWFSTSASAGKVKALRRDPESAVAYVMPEDDAEVGALLRGACRVFHPRDVVAMATHGAVIAAAQTALAVKNYTSVAGYVADATKVPAMWRPTQRVMVRFTVESTELLKPPQIGPGIAPGLPPVVPPELRRLLAGQRRVVLGSQVDGGLGLMPAVWGAGMALSLPEGMGVPEGAAVCAVLDHDPGFRPTEVSGLAISGIWADGRIKARRARWWSGFDGDAADISGSMVAPIVIPD